MPHTPTTPTIVLCDALVTYLKAQWGPVAPDTVERAHNGQTIDDGLTEGRHVRVVPLSYSKVAADRGDDWYTHRIGVVTLEKYPDATDPKYVIPIDWIDERVDFVHTEIVKRLDLYRNGSQPTFNRMVVTREILMDAIYDPGRLRSGQFWSEVEFDFEELEAI